MLQCDSNHIFVSRMLLLCSNLTFMTHAHRTFTQDKIVASPTTLLKVTYIQAIVLTILKHESAL